MDDVAIRLKCLEIAVSDKGNPNNLQQAKAYYEWVSQQDTPATVETETPARKGRKS
jgi:hypothetical protein